MFRCFIFLLAILLPGVSRAIAQEKGHLLIVGGGLRPDNAAVFERLIKYAGGKEKARFGVFPTASLVNSDAKQMKLILGRMGVPEHQVQVIDILEANAKVQAESPKIVEQIRQCSGIYFEGGDQTRITRSLTRGDGGQTPALAAIYEAWHKGAVIAGSSAGAAVQSETMISVAGLPDDTLDEGMDTLDFGLTTNRFHRGLFVSRGLGFIQSGIIDQHFGQYRGRLGRLSRVVVEKRAALGFGIDENTALDVSPDGSIEIVGEGTVTVVNGAEAEMKDGPFGCRILGVRLSLLENGDRFDPKTGRATPRKEKKPLGKPEFNGNFLLPDIGGRGAAMDAILAGLADNTARKQVGITLKHNQHFAHGYKFTFQKTDNTRCHGEYIDGLYSYTVLDARLDIEPIDGALRSPARRFPKDLPPQLAAIFFRGILLPDEDGNLRLDDKLTRAELAGAIAHTVRLEPPRENPPRLADVPEDAPFAEEMALVVGNKLMDCDNKGAFHPARSITRAEAAEILVRLAEHYQKERLPATRQEFADIDALPPRLLDAAFAAVGYGLLKTEQDAFQPKLEITRRQTALALYRIIGFSW